MNKKILFSTYSLLAAGATIAPTVHAAEQSETAEASIENSSIEQIAQSLAEVTITPAVHASEQPEAEQQTAVGAAAGIDNNSLEQTAQSLAESFVAQAINNVETDCPGRLPSIPASKINDKIRETAQRFKQALEVLIKKEGLSIETAIAQLRLMIEKSDAKARAKATGLIAGNIAIPHE